MLLPWETERGQHPARALGGLQTQKRHIMNAVCSETQLENTHFQPSSILCLFDNKWHCSVVKYDTEQYWCSIDWWSAAYVINFLVFLKWICLNTHHEKFQAFLERLIQNIFYRFLKFSFGFQRSCFFMLTKTLHVNLHYHLCPSDTICCRKEGGKSTKHIFRDYCE